MNTRRVARQKPADARCALASSPALSRRMKSVTDSIAPNFPAGIARPALRALNSAGLTELRHLSRIREADLAALHGMGPKALDLLRSAMRSAGIQFKR